MDYHNQPKSFLQLKEQSEWNFDYSNDTMDDYFLRTPFCRIKGNWDPKNIAVFEEKNKSVDATTEMQTFSGLSMKDRYVEGLLDDRQTEIKNIVNCLPLGKTRTLKHLQKPGQMHMLHMDANYGGGFWDYPGEEKDQKNCEIYDHA